jgi:sarcosine oxidase, subunit alpha
MDRRIYDHPHRRFERGAPVAIEFEGATYRAYEGEPVAVALFAAGVNVLSRSIKYHRPRAFFCLAGHCNGCLMRVAGLPNVRACVAPASEGLICHGQNAFPASDLDLLGAVDWLFPKGMDHHTLMTGSKVLNTVMQKVVRQLSGLGTLPERAAPSFPDVVEREVDVLVVGGGPAGLAAAAAAARAGATTLCVDENDLPGGSLLAEPGQGPAAAAIQATEAAAAGAEILSSAVALSWFPEDAGGLLAVATPERLHRLRARRYVYATGAYEANALFQDNDRPGVFAARAVGRLAGRWGVKPGNQVVVLGASEYAAALAAELAALDVETARVDGVNERIVRARGRTWITAVDVVDTAGRKRRIACDALAVATTPSPASEAPRSHGAATRLDPAAGGFAVVVDETGHTNVPGVLACGDVTGFVGPARATAHGARVGAIAAREAKDARSDQEARSR